MSKDLTRTRTLSPRSDPTEISRWLNSIAVRGNFDWMPGALYSRNPLKTLPYVIQATYDDYLSVLFTPRVRSRIQVTGCLDIDATGTANLILVGFHCTPSPLSSSGTDQSAAAPADYARVTPINGGFRDSPYILNSFDLAAGVPYTIALRAKALLGTTARVNEGSSMCVLHFPLLTPAGQ